ncbi:MAG TPA: hypothetical protein VF763_08015 [Candidatus Limnocylindrales bacterium]
MSEVEVSAARAGDGWRCEVVVRDAGSATRHLVGVDRPTLERLAPGATDPLDLVRRSFDFLLAREPKESILRSFELPLIGRYFPEYEAEIRGG